MYQKYLPGRLHQKYLPGRLYQKYLQCRSYQKCIQGRLYQKYLPDELYQKYLQCRSYQKYIQGRLYQKYLPGKLYQSTSHLIFVLFFFLVFKRSCFYRSFFFVNQKTKWKPKLSFLIMNFQIGSAIVMFIGCKPTGYMGS